MCVCLLMTCFAGIGGLMHFFRMNLTAAIGLSLGLNLISAMATLLACVISTYPKRIVEPDGTVAGSAGATGVVVFALTQLGLWGFTALGLGM